MTSRYLVAGFAIAARLVDAQACSGKTTISNAAQATGLASCSTYQGDIWIDEKTTDDIALEGISRITGGLYARNVDKITSLSASTLSEIQDTFGLDTLSQLTNLNFPSLTSVGSIIWEGLPSLSGLSFTQSVQKANVLSIQNTNLASLDGIDLEKIDQLFLANNFFLDDVSMKLGSVSQALGMSSNGRNLQVDFPNLEWAYNMTFRNVSSLKLASLASINQSMGLYSNFFQEFEAPNLTLVGGSLSFVSNGMLADISFPELKGIGGGFQLANNTKLMKVDGFPKLQQVLGAVEMYGTFTSVELPKINLVKGAFNLQSSKSLGNTCSKFSSIAGPNEDIRGKFTCEDKVDNLPIGSSSASGNDSSGAGSLLIPYATGIIGVVATIFGML